MDKLIEEQEERERLIRAATDEIKALRKLGVSREELEKLVYMTFEEAEREEEEE